MVKYGAHLSTLWVSMAYLYLSLEYGTSVYPLVKYGAPLSNPWTAINGYGAPLFNLWFTVTHLCLPLE